VLGERLPPRVEDRRDPDRAAQIPRITPEGSILMLGRDLRPIAEMQQQLVKAQLALELFNRFAWLVGLEPLHTFPCQRQKIARHEKTC